jgi:aromatic-amino-acid transaminase
MFQHIPGDAGDAIFSLHEKFLRDPRAHKVDLSVGMYFDDEGRVPVMQAVREAEIEAARRPSPKPYQPMEGSAAYRQAVQRLVFGAQHDAARGACIATLQTPGGSSALRIGGDFLRSFFAGTGVWLSDPSWNNHKAIFAGAGFEVHSYPYLDPSTKGLRVAAMLDRLDGLPPHSVVVLHACCHNPTGLDLSHEQWVQVAKVCRERQLIAFLDFAYQGFGDGIEEDALAVRVFLDAGLRFLVANSFSKNFSLYGERCGALSVVCRDAQEVDRVMSQLQASVRRIYSNPPTHGGALVAQVLASPRLRTLWELELGSMRQRIRAMRERLHAGLSAAYPAEDFSHYLAQRGMFSFTGLSAGQVAHLRQAHAIYLIDSGRLCVAGLNERNVDRVVQAIVSTLGLVEQSAA